MKLIRLEGVNSKAEFENTFNEDIILKEKAKIGLLNMAYTPRPHIEIGTDNDTFHFITVKDIVANVARKRTVTLTHGSYLPHDFITMLNTRINTALVYIANERGFAWKPHIELDRLVLSFARTTSNTVPNFADKSFGDLDFNKTTNTLTQNGDPAQLFGGSAYTLLPFIKGCGLFRGELVKIATTIGQTDDFCIGFIQDIDVIINPAFDPNKMLFGLKSVYTGDGVANHTYNYRFLVEGVDTTVDNSVLVEANNVIVFTVSQGVISANVWQTKASANGTTIGTYTYSFSETLHPIVSCSSDGFQMKDFHYNPDPFHKKTFTGVTHILGSIPDRDNYIIDDDNDTIAGDFGLPPPPFPVAPSIVSLFFDSKPKTGKILGYNNEIISLHIKDGNFVADVDLLLSVTNPSVIVEIPSIKFESFDSTLNKRRNMVAIVPTSLKDNKHIYYQTDNPIMISVDNKNEITLRNISIRLTGFDNEVILIREGTNVSMSIVISD